MADYYPLLARAIGGLPNKDGSARTVVYERARKALLNQLRNANPPLQEEDVAREQSSLEDAIRRLELDYAVPEANDPAEVSERESTASALEAPALEPVETAPASPVEPSAPDTPAATEPAEPEVDDLAGYHELVEAAEQRRPASDDWSVEAVRPAQGQDFSALRPSSGADGVPVAEAPGDAHSAYPEDDKPRGGRGKLIAALVAVVLLLAGGAAYIFKGDALMGGDGSAPVSRNVAGAPATGPEMTKSMDRIAQAPSDGSSRAAAGSGGAQTLGVAERAVLFEETAGGGDQGLQQFVGSVVWSLDSFSPGEGLAPDVGIKAEVSIPDRGIKVTLRLRRNLDSSIPASHIFEAEFDLPPNFDLGPVANVPGIRAKASEAAQGQPLIGLPVRVAPGFFLIGLSSRDADIQRNLGLLITRNWVDLPMQFESGRRTILAMEKGGLGDQVFREAYTAWGLPVPQ